MVDGIDSIEKRTKDEWAFESFHLKGHIMLLPSLSNFLLNEKRYNDLSRINFASTRRHWINVVIKTTSNECIVSMININLSIFIDNVIKHVQNSMIAAHAVTQKCLEKFLLCCYKTELWQCDSHIKWKRTEVIEKEEENEYTIAITYDYRMFLFKMHKMYRKKKKNTQNLRRLKLERNKSKMYRTIFCGFSIFLFGCVFLSLSF